MAERASHDARRVTSRVARREWRGMSRHVVEARGWCLGDALKCYFYRLGDVMCVLCYAML